MILKIENTSIKGRYNLVDESLPNHDDDRYVKQLSLEEVKFLGKSIIDIIGS